MNQYTSIGKFVATHGLQGDLILRHNLGKKTTLKGLETLFLEPRTNEMIPYFISQAKARNGEETYVKLENVDTKEAARKFIQKEVWLPDSEAKQLAAASAPVSLLGYQIIQQQENLGEIVEVIEQPHQMLCKIMLSGNEAYIPIHEETLLKIDKKKRQVYVSLPEGLLDIYR